MRDYFQRVVTFADGMYYGEFHTSRALCDGRRDAELKFANKSGNAAIIGEEVVVTTMQRLQV